MTTYTVTFEDGMGNVLSEQEVEEGKAAAAPEDPTREGYVFTGWDTDFTNVTADITVNAQWEEEEPEPTPTPEPEPSQEPEEQEQAAEPEEQEQAAEPESEEPEAEPVPEEEVVVTAKGVIIDGDESKMTVVIDINGEKVELKGDADTKIASGYFPDKGDTIEVKYTKSDLVIKEIKLLEKAPVEEPAPEPEATKEDAAEAESDEED